MSELRSRAIGELEPSIAIVGSGPAGCYTAQMLRKRWAAAQIVVFERLPRSIRTVTLRRVPGPPGHEGGRSAIRSAVHRRRRAPDRQRRSGKACFDRSAPGCIRHRGCCGGARGGSPPPRRRR
ncbi:NAD(P)-binding protein [Rhodococcus sp. ZPP]|nr:NAD(P)-binding protein [Rhodococcus sp. ZPP]